MTGKRTSTRPTAHPATAHPVTPDGRYFVVKGQLWRRSNPDLEPGRRERLVQALMAARREIGLAGRAGDTIAVARARQRVDAAKRALGERGAVWWTDGAEDFNRRPVGKTPYAAWFEALASVGSGAEPR
jgi:hypothetical protein